jgi:DNA-binding response OmpR family regulator
MENTDIAEKLNILIVDDNEPLLASLAAGLKLNNFHVTTAVNVGEALHLIDSEPFDVLLSDLHMPGAGDGLTVVSAMRHKNPEAVTLLLSGYPELKAAVAAILLQADEVLVKPFAISALVETIRAKIHNRGARPSTTAKRVASILESDARTTIGKWLTRVLREEELTRVPMTEEQRTGHLPSLMRELVQYLREPRSLGTNHVSEAAVQHGKVRREQGYSIPMIIEESRILQVSIFETLQRNLGRVDYSLLLIDVMTIADEVDSQLKQTIISFSGTAVSKVA